MLQCAFIRDGLSKSDLAFQSVDGFVLNRLFPRLKATEHYESAKRYRALNLSYTQCVIVTIVQDVSLRLSYSYRVHFNGLLCPNVLLVEVNFLSFFDFFHGLVSTIMFVHAPESLV